MNLFVFPNSISRKDENEKIKLNINDNVLEFFYNDTRVMIDTDVLRDGSSTMVMNNPITEETYVLYNFRELLEVLNLTPSEMLEGFQQRGFMQIDKCAGDVFIKVLDVYKRQV